LTVENVTGDIIGSVSLPDGTAPLPSASFASDPNTGLYSAAADTIGFSTGGAGRLTLGNSILAPVTAEQISLGTGSFPFGNINIGDDVYFQMYQAGSLRSFLGYTAAAGTILDSDSSIRIQPNNVYSLKYTDGLDEVLIYHSGISKPFVNLTKNLFCFFGS
jgi:hypothetical protein